MLPALFLALLLWPSGEPHPAPGTSSETAPTAASPASADEERPVHALPLAGPLAAPNAEVSGLAWHGDDLLLLPQHPFRMSGQERHGLLFALARDEIEAVLSGRHPGPLRPRPVTLLADGLETRSPTYQGCEALAVRGDRVFLATEAVADAATGAMRGWLFAGRIRNDTLRLDTRRRGTLPPQTQASNMAYEALLTAPGQRVMALYEANGRSVNARPHALLFSSTLQSLSSLALPPLEYRLTDATTMDADGRFWVANYLFPGEMEKLRTALDSLPDRGGDASPPGSQPVERLVELRFRNGRLHRTDARPLRLLLRPDAPRNWEGLARFRSEARGPGFLLVTDQYPGTVLGFVVAGT